MLINLMGNFRIFLTSNNQKLSSWNTQTISPVPYMLISPPSEVGFQYYQSRRQDGGVGFSGLGIPAFDVSVFVFCFLIDSTSPAKRNLIGNCVHRLCYILYNNNNIIVKIIIVIIITINKNIYIILNPLHDRLLSQMSFVSLVWSLQEILRPCFKLFCDFCGRMSCVIPCFGPDQQIQGYEYLVIDDCWASDRGEDGVLIPDPAAFPDGMKPVADYVHSKDWTMGSPMGSPMGFVPKKWRLKIIWLIILPSKDKILSICKYITWINIGVYGKSYPA